MPDLPGAVISARLATLAELQTVYGLEDLYNLGEVLVIDARNRETIRDWQAAQGG